MVAMGMNNKFYDFGNGRIELAQGSVTQYPADVLVVPNIPELEMVAFPGGVQYSFLKDGGEEIFREANKIAQEFGIQPFGSAHLTTAGRLSAKYVLHSVGPHARKDIIRDATRNALLVTQQKGLESIGFPAFGTGLYNFPLDEAIDIMSDEAINHLKNRTSVKRVGFVLYSSDDYTVARRVLDRKK